MIKNFMNLGKVTCCKLSEICMKSVYKILNIRIKWLIISRFTPVTETEVMRKKSNLKSTHQ